MPQGLDARPLYAPRAAAVVSPGVRFLDREIRGVIFDLDGVLAPTLANHVKAYREVLATLGVPVEHHDVAFREGQRSHEIIQWIAEKNGHPLPEDEARRLSLAKNARFRDYPHPGLYPDVRATFDALTKMDLPIALATGTHKANIRHILADVANTFAAVVAAEDVKEAKPHPEPYLKAAAALGLDPATVLVVENAPLGVASGKAAGCSVVALTTTVTAEDLKGADRVVGSLTEMLGLLARSASGSGSTGPGRRT